MSTELRNNRGLPLQHSQPFVLPWSQFFMSSALAVQNPVQDKEAQTRWFIVQITELNGCKVDRAILGL